MPRRARVPNCLFLFASFLIHLPVDQSTALLSVVVYVHTPTLIDFSLFFVRARVAVSLFFAPPPGRGLWVHTLVLRVLVLAHADALHCSRLHTRARAPSRTASPPTIMVRVQAQASPPIMGFVGSAPGLVTLLA